jgi:SAM-dependent methyltransferase
MQLESGSNRRLMFVLRPVVVLISVSSLYAALLQVRQGSTSALTSHTPFNSAPSPAYQAGMNTEAIDKMRDRDQQPEKVMDVIKLKEGMRVGEAGASYGYFTFKMSKRVGNAGTVYANDIDPTALQLIEQKCKSGNITNIKTVLGAVEDPLYPRNDLDMVVVFDCLFEFSEPLKWMKNARKYLKLGGKLVIVDPDPSKFANSDFLSRKQIGDFGAKSGYSLIAVDDSFLKNHMIIVLQPINSDR